MNRDYSIEKQSDCILRFEFLGANNADYVFDAADDWLQIELEDIAGNCPAAPIIISLEGITNPVTVNIPWTVISTFKSNPIKYKLFFSTPTFQIVLLSGYIYATV